MRAKLSRHRFLEAAGAGAAWLALSGMPGCEPVERTTKRTPSTSSPGGQGHARVIHSPPARPQSVRAFRSRPDLRPPGVEVVAGAHDTAPGYVFVAPKKGESQEGPMIVDDRGEPVWFRPMRGKHAMDFKAQQYRGEPVLTWYEGVGTSYGRGEYVIADGSYREITRVRAGNGYEGDHHEFLVTPQGTALITIYNPLPWDLSPFGGLREGVVVDGIAQEIDIESGEVLFEWHSLDHVGLEESYAKPSKDSKWPFDYFHINSIDLDHDGNLLVSARKTFAIYKLDRESGEIIWRLGGRYSDFAMAAGARSRYQHDARRQPDGTLTFFDNGGVYKNDQSYGVALELDTDEMAADVARKYAHPEKRLAATQGNMQSLPNGNVFIGWGSEPVFSEFDGDGELLFSANFPPEVESYRAFRSPWRGHPDDDPAVAVEPGPDGEVRVYASWNGATEVATWEVLAGPGPERLTPVGSVARDGFETAIAVRNTEPYLSVRAVDGSGRVLGTARAIKPG